MSGTWWFEIWKTLTETLIALERRLRGRKELSISSAHGGLLTLLSHDFFQENSVFDAVCYTVIGRPSCFGSCVQELSADQSSRRRFMAWYTLFSYFSTRYTDDRRQT